MNPEDGAPDTPRADDALLFCPRCQSWDLTIAQDEDAIVCRCKTCDTDFIVTNRPLAAFWNI